MDTKQVFDGIKVADFSWVAVGPQVTKVLAEHGARVVRIESHRRPENLRVVPPFKDNRPTLETGAYASSYNTNKYGLSLDLAKPRGKEIARELIKWADIVLESFAPGVMKRLGLDYEEAKKIKPDIIYCSTTFQGQYGPHALFGGLGFHGAALAGFWALSGYPGGEPAPAHTAYLDFIAPWYLVTALVAALDRRRKTNKGMYIDQAQYEAGVTFLSPAILDYTVNSRIMGRRGNRDPCAAPHGIYPCQGNDRWVAIAVFTDEEWKAFSEAIGSPQWAGERRFATLIGRKENEDELDQLVTSWTIDYTPEQVMTFMQPKGVAVGIVKTAEDLFNDPQLKHRDHFVYLEQRVVGYRAYQNQAIKFSKTPQRLWKAGPNIGEDSEYVCKEILNLTDDDISDLIAEGVITTE